VGLTEDDTIGLCVAEEEELAFDDRKAQGCAELVLAVLGNRRAALEELANVKRIVADVLPGAAVDVIRAGFDAGVNDGARRVAELGWLR
jgi:hypothetical protein